MWGCRASALYPFVGARGTASLRGLILIGDTPKERAVVGVTSFAVGGIVEGWSQLTRLPRFSPMYHSRLTFSSSTRVRTGGKGMYAARRQLRDQWHTLRKELRVREKMCVDRAARSATVVCCTATGAASKVGHIPPLPPPPPFPFAPRISAKLSADGLYV